MLKEWSERDRTKLKDAKDKMKTKLEALQKELNSDLNPKKGGQSENIGDDLALALYDQGDPNSRHN